MGCCYGVQLSGFGQFIPIVTYYLLELTGAPLETRGIGPRTFVEYLRIPDRGFRANFRAVRPRRASKAAGEPPPPTPPRAAEATGAASVGDAGRGGDREQLDLRFRIVTRATIGRCDIAFR